MYNSRYKHNRLLHKMYTLQSPYRKSEQCISNSVMIDLIIPNHENDTEIILIINI